MAISRCGMIRLLTWKNFVLQKRRPIWTCCEITVPAFFFVILMLIRLFVIEQEDVGAQTFHETYVAPFDFRTSPDNYTNRKMGLSSNPMFNKYKADAQLYPVFDTVAYYPNNDAALDEVMAAVHNTIQIVSGESFKLKAFESEEDIQPAIKNGTQILVAFGFNEALPNRNSSDINVKYSVRMSSSVAQPEADSRRPAWKTELNFPVFDSIQPRAWMEIPYWAPGSVPKDSGTNGNGFIEFQAMADAVLTAYFKDGEFATVLPQLQAYPFPEYTYDLFLTIFQGLFPFFLVVSFLLPVLLTTWGLVHEKETRMKEAMKMIGLPQWVNWTAWYIKEILFLGISVLIITIVFTAGGLLKHSNGFILFIFLMLFVLTVVSFCAMISAIFSSATLASIMSLLLFFGLYLPYTFVVADYDSLSMGSKQALCLAAPSCISIGTRILSQWESRGAGVQFDNLSENPSEADSFTMAMVFGYLFFDAILYFLIALYLENVVPGQYGVPKPPYFFLLKSYWFKQDVEETPTMAAGTFPDADVQKVDSNTSIGIAVNHVTKIWPTPNGPKTAVDDLTFNVPQDEITVLLGENGAGKSTIMSIMVGLYQSTTGSVKINGRNIATDTAAARESLGLCPQFDILFDLMTVEEHLYFYSRLKGASVADTREQIPIFVDDVDLKPKRKATAKTLSGGQKRALSVALAFIGGSKTVILDEPTSGMDPAKRRHTWKLINKHKKDRTVLLTTHFMDEADLLGERIAIMRSGQLRCAGSSMFLKDRFGCGYHLTIAKKSTDVNSLAITAAVTKHIPEVVLEEDIGAELTYQLPKDKSLAFPKLFGEIETNSETLGIESIGASVTTMEDVFLKINEGTLTKTGEEDTSDTAKEGDVLIPMVNLAGDDEVDDALKSNYEPLTGTALRMSQLKAMLVKRLTYLKRRTRNIMATIIVPTLFILVAGLTAKFGDSEGVIEIEPCRVFDTSTYTSPATYLSVNTTSSSGSADRLAQLYALGNETETFIASPLMSNSELTKFSENSNLTQKLLDEAADYQKSGFFQKTVASFSFGDSAGTDTYVYLDSQCQVRDGSGQYTAHDGSNPLKLQSGVRFRFVRKIVSTMSELKDLNYSDPKVNGIAQTISWSLNADPLSPNSTLTLSPTLMPTQAPTNASEFVNCSEISWDTNCVNQISDVQCALLQSSGGCSSSPLCPVTCGINPDLCPAECQPPPSPSPANPTDTGCSGESSSPTCVNPLVKYTGVVDGALGTFGSVMCNGVDQLVVEFVNITDVFVPDDIVAKGWFNKQAYHAAPEALNFMDNIIASNHLGSSRSVTFETSNCPLPKTNARLQDEMSSDNSFGFSLGWWMCLALGFLLASFTLFPVNERNMLSKHIQFVSGANVKVYWLAHYIFDFVTGWLVCAIFVIVIVAFDFKDFRGHGGDILLLLTLFLWAALPLTYAFTFLFKKSSIAFVVMLLIYFFISYIMLIVSFLFDVLEDQKYRCDGTADTLKQAFFLNPVFACVQGILDIATNTNNLAFCSEREAFCNRDLVCQVLDCENTCVPEFRHSENYFAMDGFMVGRGAVFMAIEGVVYTLILMFIEWFKITSFTSSKKSLAVHAADAQEDSDVKAERERVAGLGADATDTVIVKDVSKSYSRNKKKPPAVNNLSVGIPAGEVFGLLGVNGAGKTTTFRLLTGETKMSGGGAFVNGKSITSQMTEARQSLGYCPQYDGLIPLLTGRETLRMFARLRGIPSDKIEEIIEQSIQFLDLSAHSERLAGTYSGGNKRKLSTAIALLGNPSVIFLDEPTTGMDPGARRSLWNALLKVAKSGKTIVLTSHSMEECDALCTRLGIMVEGNFKCLGSTQHLKSKFGKGYQLIAKLKEDIDVDKFNSHISTQADGAVLTAEHQRQLTYAIDGKQQMSELFAIMEHDDTQALLDDYSLSQTTLEQVFLKFANEDEEATEAAATRRSSVGIAPVTLTSV